MNEYNGPVAPIKENVAMRGKRNIIMKRSRNMQNRLTPHITLMEVRSDARGEGGVWVRVGWGCGTGRPSAPIGETESSIAVQPQGRNAAMSFGCPTVVGAGVEVTVGVEVEVEVG